MTTSSVPVVSSMKRLLCILMPLLVLPLAAQEKTDPTIKPKPIVIQSESLGDAPGGVVARITIQYTIPPETPPEVPLVIQGSILQAGRVVRNFRYGLEPASTSPLRVVQTLPVGSVEIEARVLIPLEESAPILLGKGSATFNIILTGKPFVADESDGAEAFVAEGAASESAGAVRILPPRRDLAPNLFIVNVEVKAPVTRVEFFVEDKKIFTRNAPPYRAELDLGRLPKRVEVRVIGYDSAGRYVDADAWIVNERESPLEVKITRTVTADGYTHFKLSIQNPQNREIKSVAFFLGDKKLADFSRPPYALTLPSSKLTGGGFVRAAVVDETNYEASDLLFLDGQRYGEELEVNLVELPVSVADAAGVPIVSLTRDDFEVLEQGKPKKISTFGFSSNLPLSVGVIVDHSGSMKPRMSAAREAAVAFFKQILRPGDRGFAAGFSFDVSKVAPFGSSVATLEEQIKAIPDAEGATALYDAIVTGLYRFRSVSGRKALVMVTDGEDTASRISYDEMLAYARAARVPIYFIGIGLSMLDFPATSTMKSLAAETGAVAYFAGNVKELPKVYEQLERELRSQYLLSYYTESSKTDSAYRTVEVKTRKKDAKVRTIRGFIP